MTLAYFDILLTSYALITRFENVSALAISALLKILTNYAKMAP